MACPGHKSRLWRCGSSPGTLRRGSSLYLRLRSRRTPQAQWRQPQQRSGLRRPTASRLGAGVCGPEEQKAQGPALASSQGRSLAAAGSGMPGPAGLPFLVPLGAGAALLLLLLGVPLEAWPCRPSRYSHAASVPTAQIPTSGWMPRAPASGECGDGPGECEPGGLSQAQAVLLARQSGSWVVRAAPKQGRTWPPAHTGINRV